MTVQTPLSSQYPARDEDAAVSGGSSQKPKYLLAMVWDFRKGLCIGAACGLFIGLIVILCRPSYFTSTATLIFPSAPISKLSALTGGSSGDLPSVPLLEGALLIPQPGTSASTASLILQSNLVRDTLFANLQLQTSWKRPSLRDARRYYSKHLICKTGKSGELEVGFQDTDPKRSYQIAQALLDALDHSVKSLGIDPAERNLHFLEQQAKRTYDLLMAAQRDLQSFQERNHLVSVTDQAKILTSQYTTLQGDAVAASIEAEAASREQQVLASKSHILLENGFDLNSSDTNAPIGRLYQQVQNLEAVVAVLRHRLTDNHPDVQVKQHELDVARQQLRGEVARQLALVNKASSPTLVEAVAKTTLYRAKAEGIELEIHRMRPLMDHLPAQLTAFIRLSKKVEALIEGYTLYNRELEKARIIVQSREPIYVVVDPLENPQYPDPAFRALILLFFLIFGIIIAMTIPYYRWFQQLQEAGTEVEIS